MDNARPEKAGGNLLVVDDDLHFRQTLEALLIGEGHEVRCAARGGMALRFAGEDVPELILLDIRLPDMDGFEVCRRLKEDRRTHDIPVIFISGLNEVVDKVKGFAAGGVDYVTKPFQAQEVLARVGLHLELNRAKEAVREANEELERKVAERTREVEGRLRFEHLISDLSARFVNPTLERIDEEIQDALGKIREFFGVDRCGLVQVLHDRDKFQVTHAAFAKDIPAVPKGVELPLSLHPWAYDKMIRKREVLFFSRIDELPPEANVDKETWVKWGIRSNLNIPIIIGGHVEHIIAINSVRNERAWPEEFVPRLRLLGEIFVNAIERCQGEQALRESEERLSLAVSGAQAGLWVMDVSNGLVWVTDKLRELFQFTPDEELSLERFIAAIHPDDRERVRELVRQSLEKGQMLQVEYRILHPDGNIRWIAARGRPYSKTPGQTERLMGVSFDVTEREEMEIRLREQLEEIARLKLQLEKENIYLRQEIKLQYIHEEIVGRSEKMKKVLSQVEQVAGTDSTVLIQGETGTGKELLARAIHHLSSRKDRPLVTVNCASLPPTLIESELFGREKGAYTGALARMVGRFEVADGTTLFLDEIGELPLEVQSKLLRVLEEGRFERLGSTMTLQVNVRIIAATNRNLAQDVNEGKFRKDLYYRLNVFPIEVPPLRERPEDIPLLVWAFVRHFEKKMGKRVDSISRKSMEALQRHSWPGNVRELRNVIEHAMIVSSGRNLAFPSPKSGLPEAPDTRNLQDLERRHILDVLEKSGWRLSGEGGASEILGLNRTTLQWRMKKLGIKRPAR
jgi:PAS domain S-box-containing protein